MQHAIETPSIFAPVYARYSSVDDQALAGVIMWVPGSLPLLLPMLRLIVDLSSGRVAMEGHHA
jgi:cytochrome c oxidase assembly factor CtaG